MDLELSDKACLVTGASRGIGAAIAAKFLEEGANVTIVSRGSDALYQQEDHLKNQYSPQKLQAEACDCTNPEELKSLCHRVEARWGGLDIVVANVGDGRSVPDGLPDEQQWDKTWCNNFESALHTARTFLPLLQRSKGCLLFVSSITAKEAFGAPVDYSTAKTAMTALAKNMARKLAQDVRINVIAPGNVYFPGGSWCEKEKQNPEKVKQIIQNSVPMKRFGKPEEIADAAVFLCSARAAFITGSVLVVDGGQTVGIF